MDRFREETKRHLVSLSFKKQLLFGVIICERLYPSYIEFNRLYDWGQISVLQDAIDMIRQYIIDESLFDSDEVQEMMERVEMQTPDTEDFSGVMTSLALNSCTAIFSTLKYVLNKDSDDIADVATYARDTVDTYIQERDKLNSEDPKLTQRIESSQLMILEKDYQKQLMIKLSGMSTDKVTDNMVRDLAGDKLDLDFSLLLE